MINAPYLVRDREHLVFGQLALKSDCDYWK